MSRISGSNLIRTHDKDVFINGVCGGPDADSLLLADSHNGTVRAINMHTGQLFPKDLYRCQDGEGLYDVAYSVDTLFIATRDRETLKLLSFARNQEDWVEGGCLQTDLEVTSGIVLRVLPDGTLLCSELLSDRVLVCSMDDNRAIKCTGTFTLPKRHWGFDVKFVGEEIRLAAALCDCFVALFRVKEDCAVEELSREQLKRQPRYPLFCGDTVLVQEEADGYRHKVVAMSTAGDRLHRTRVLDSLEDQFGSKASCIVRETLVALNPRNQELQFYSTA